MAEQVNQRVEEMINELEQMSRTQLYSNEEIREISRRRKEFEYRVQRQTKQKQDFIHYIAYDMALLEDISLRRKQMKLKEKRADIEYTIANRLNKIFKQFIYRFQNDAEVYFQYIKFCKSVGFEHAISGIIGQMLQVYGDKPKMWQLASKWESEELDNAENAREFLLKGVHRHPDSEFLFQDLFNLELTMALKADNDMKLRNKQLKRATVVWKNGVKNNPENDFVFKLHDIAEKFDFAEDVVADIRKEIWSRHSTDQDVWAYVAGKELKGQHWEEVDEFVSEDDSLPSKLNNFVHLYEEALQKFPDENLCDQYIHELLKLDEVDCPGGQLIRVVKRALRFGHDWRVLSADMYALWVEVLNQESEMTAEEIMEILDAASKIKPQSRRIWQEIIILNKGNEKMMESFVMKANKHLKPVEMVTLWNVLLDNVSTKSMIKKLCEKVRNCDSVVLLSVKPRLLKKSFELNGIKAARELYDELQKTPPLLLEIYNLMIGMESEQDIVNVKILRKCYEGAVHNFGTDNFEIWLKYITFETAKGDPKCVGSLYRRAVAALKPGLVEQFIERRAVGEIKTE